MATLGKYFSPQLLDEKKGKEGKTSDRRIDGRKNLQA